MTIRELSRLHRISPGRVCLILAWRGYVFDFNPLRPVRECPATTTMQTKS